MTQKLTYGNLPSFVDFELAYSSQLGEKPFVVTQDPYVGEMTYEGADELYDALGEASDVIHSDNETLSGQAGNFASGVLTSFGFEWV